jgi:hypothetical protein
VIVGAGIVIPVALLAALGLLAGLRLWPPVRRRMDGSTPPAAQDSA